MIHHWLAELIVVVHFGFLVFVVAGALLLLRWRRLMWLHVPAVAWGALIEFRGWVCPLTPLENHFRHLAGEAGYGGGFIDHYITAVMYPDGLSRATQVVLGVLVLAGNAAIYAWILRRGRGRRAVA